MKMIKIKNKIILISISKNTYKMNDKILLIRIFNKKIKFINNKAKFFSLKKKTKSIN